MRIGHLEKAILTVLQNHGAKTCYELLQQIESGENRWTRQKAFLRTIQQLRKKNLVIPKPYFQYRDYFCLAFAHIFWAEGTYWKRYCGGGGFVRKKTRCFHYGYHHIFGLTHEGKHFHKRAHMTF